MPRTRLSPDEIRTTAIDATVSRIRLHGFEKVRLVDVAKDMGLSHAALYAHFADRAALLDAVTARWLDATDAALEAICQTDKAPLDKIEDWFVKRYQLKRERVLMDPQLYRAFDAASESRKPFVGAHLVTAKRQLVGLLEDAAELLNGGPAEAQAALLVAAMSAFHHPKLVAEHLTESREPLLKQVLRAMLAGMVKRG